MLANISGTSKKHDSDDESPKAKPKPPNMMILALLVLIWYSTAIVAVTTSRKTMLLVPLPYMLCTSQFATAWLMTIVLQYLSKSNRKPPSIPALNHLVILIAFSYTFGFIFTNVAISVVNPSFVETVKSAEPFSSVLLGYFYFNEGTSTLTYLTLIPICGGVALSCLDNASFNLWGLVAAALSNLGFSSRSVVTKRMNREFPHEIDEVLLFGKISHLGFLLLVPLTFFLEYHRFIELSASPDFSGRNLITLLVLNGLAYSTYNLVSFVVLARTDLVTHAVLNVFRRVVIIACTALYFQIELNIINVIGVIISVAGVFAFAYSKNIEKKDDAVIARSSSTGNLLPSPPV